MFSKERGSKKTQELPQLCPLCELKTMAPDKELPPDGYLVASCRNLSNCYCKKLYSGGPLSLHGFGGLKVNLVPKPNRGVILSVHQGALQPQGSWEQAKSYHVTLSCYKPQVCEGQALPFLSMPPSTILDPKSQSLLNFPSSFKLGNEKNHPSPAPLLV